MQNFKQIEQKIPEILYFHFSIVLQDCVRLRHIYVKQEHLVGILDEEEWFALLTFQTASKILTLATAMIVTEILFLYGTITNRTDS